jgi:RNA polymerase sigma-70 factor (sigma-E family)
VESFDGFPEFLKACGGALSRTAYLLTGEHQGAEELLQSALVKTAARWRRVVAGGDPEAYVRRVMINERTSWWRRRRPIVVSELPEPLTLVDEYERANQRISLEAALRALAPRQRAIIVLRFYHDYSVADAAAVLRCSTGTIKSQTHDALHRLRALVPDLSVQAGAAVQKVGSDDDSRSS